MLTPFVLCPWEDGDIDYSVSSPFFVFHKMSIVPGFKPSVRWLREELMNNADEWGGGGERGRYLLLSFGFGEVDPHLKA